MNSMPAPALSVLVAVAPACCRGSCSASSTTAAHPPVPDLLPWHPGAVSEGEDGKEGFRRRGKTPPLPCVPAAFVAKTLPFLADLRRLRTSPRLTSTRTTTRRWSGCARRRWRSRRPRLPMQRSQGQLSPSGVRCLRFFDALRLGRLVVGYG